MSFSYKIDTKINSSNKIIEDHRTRVRWKN